MTSIAILGATGSLGTHVARQAAAAGKSLSLLVRSPGRLPPEVAARAQVVTADLITAPPATLAQFAEGHDVLACCAGLVTEGQKFVALVDRVASAVETLPVQARPLYWFMAGAALLDLDTNGRRGVDLASYNRVRPPPIVGSIMRAKLNMVPATRLKQHQSRALMSKSQFALSNRVTVTEPLHRSIST